jgi:ketosteroid isomerase-like protein
MKHVSKIKFIACNLIAVLLGSSLSFGQSAFSQKYGTEDDYKRLYYLNTQYIQSWLRSDTGTYNRLLWAEDFVQNGANGLLMPKKSLMPVFGQPRFKEIEYFYAENVTVQFITNDVAIVFARTPFKGVGQSVESVSQYNDVYVKREGKWICVSANISMITKPGSPSATFTKVPEPVSLISYHAGSEKDRNILKELNEKHAEAFMRNKVQLVENIFADDYVLLASNGMLYKKPEVLKQIMDGANQNMVDSYSIENLNICFVTSNVAMIRAVAVIKLKNGEKSALQYNDIYVNRGGNWVCVSGNDTPVKN